MTTNFHAKLTSLLKVNGIAQFPDSWAGFDAFLPVIELLRREGAVFVLKIDGERAWPVEGESPCVTVIISKGRLGNRYVHVEETTLELGMAHALTKYFDS